MKKIIEFFISHQIYHKHKSRNEDIPCTFIIGDKDTQNYQHALCSYQSRSFTFHNQN